MTFGEKLVFYRTKKQMTQKALAEALDITPTRLNYWEKGKREPDVEMIRQLSDLLGVSADVLIGLKDEEEIKKSPAPESAEDEEQAIDELEEELRSVLLKHGLLQGGDITPDQNAFLKHVFALILAYFQKSI